MTSLTRFLREAIAAVRVFFDPTREPLRRSVYTALALIVSASVAGGLLTGAAAVTLTGVLSSVLIGAVAEKIRSVVTPVADPHPDDQPVDDDPGRHAAPDTTP